VLAAEHEFAWVVNQNGAYRKHPQAPAGYDRHSLLMTSYRFGPTDALHAVAAKLGSPRHGVSSSAAFGGTTPAAQHSTVRVHLETSSPLVPTNMPCAALFALRRTLYQRLQPVRIVEYALGIIQRRVQAYRVLGAHFRSDNLYFDYPVVPRTNTGGKVLFGEEGSTEYTLFLETMFVMMGGTRSQAADAQPAEEPVDPHQGPRKPSAVLLVSNDCSGRLEANAQELMQQVWDIRRARVTTVGVADTEGPPAVFSPRGVLREHLSAMDTELDGLRARVRAGAGTGTAEVTQSVAELQALRDELSLLLAGFCDSGGVRDRWNARAALVDWLALGRFSGVLLGSYWSSFSEEASLVRGIPGATPMSLGDGSPGFLLMLPNVDSPISCNLPPYTLALAHRMQRMGIVGKHDGLNVTELLQPNSDTFGDSLLFMSDVRDKVRASDKDRSVVFFRHCKRPLAESLRKDWNLESAHIYCMPL
jgi:hypothetical protein